VRPQVYGGRALTDDEITGLLIATLFAGQHTSSITSAWTGYLLIANKARRCARAPLRARAARRAARLAPCVEPADPGCSQKPPRGSAKRRSRGPVPAVLRIRPRVCSQNGTAVH